jgi:UDP-3-O-[3-hydroxymyristoyl] glucosamine N-acyltransferase
LKLPRPYALSEIAELVNCQFKGSADHIITGINEIHRVEQGDIVFVDHPKYYEKALNCAATTIIINKEVECPTGKGLLISDDPFRDYNFITRHFSPPQNWVANIDPGAKIGKNTIIRPGAIVGPGVVIGDNCLIHAGVVVYDNCQIGNEVIIHANTVIGADAFYYKKRESGFDKMHTCGRVVIEDRVEIGALCTIDRGVSADTIIGAGTKIDNHVQIGHDCILGKNCLLASHVGMAGCSTLEDGVTLWGQVGLVSDITVGKGAVVLGQSGLMSSVEGGKTYFGSPAVEARVKFREIALTRKLEDFFKNNPD